MSDQIVETPKPKIAPENVFQPTFNELPRPGSDTTRTDTVPRDNDQKTDGQKSDTAIPDTSKSPRPGNIPSVKLSEGTDVFLPDMNWDVLDQGLVPGANKKVEKPGEKRSDDQPGSEKPADVAPEAQPGDALPKNLTINSDTKKIDKIEYPDGKKVREFTHDSNRGLVGIRQTDETGSKDYVKKDDGKWYLKAGSLELPLAGEFDLRENGEFCLRNSTNAPWQVESPDGKISIERPQLQLPTNDTTGGAPRRQLAEITPDKHGNVGNVKLPDGSTRGYKFDESGKQLLQITDRVKLPGGGERVEEWTRQAMPTGGFGEKFVRTNPPGSNETRENLKQLANGGYEYTDAKGERKSSQLAMQGEGKPETPWKANVQKDEQGRFKSIESDRFKREYQYFDGTTKIKSYSVVDKQTGQSSNWSRNDPMSPDWTARTGDGRIASMKGEFAITDDGVHVVQRLSSSEGAGPENYAFLGDGTKVGIKATDGNGLVASEGGQARYVKRADGSTVSYVGSDNNQISVFDASTKTRTNWTKGADGLWKSDSPYEPDARKDLKFNEQGELSYADDKGNVRTRTLAGEDIIARKDGSKLVYDNSGKLSKIMFGDTTRTFEKDSKGVVTGVIETNSKGESKTVFPPPLERGEKIENAKLSDAGDLQYSIKGMDGKLVKQVTDRSNGLKLEHDKDNFLTKSTTRNGLTRTFEYVGEGANKQLAMVRDTRATKDGERSTVWARKANAQGGLSEDFYSVENGKERTRKIGNVLPDGDYEYTNADSKPGDKPRVQKLMGGDGAFTGNVEDSRFNLREQMEKQLDEPRLKRMDEMMKAFEQRMVERAQARKLAKVTSPEQIDDEVSKSVSRTYDTLTQMVNSDDPNTFFDKNQRAFLAENFLFHAQDPTTMDQGAASDQDWEGHGTCWIQAAHIWGMTQRTEHMADLLKQVSLTGSYTTKNSGEKGAEPKTVQFSKNFLSFPEGYQESGWNITKASDYWDRQPGLIRKCDGDRSPVGKIFDFTLPVIGGRPQRARSMDGGTHESFTTTGNQWYTGNAEIMQMVTGDKPCDLASQGHGKNTLLDGDFRKTLLEKGSVLNYSPGHMKSLHLKQVEGKWCIIQDNQHGEYDDRIIARISDIDKWASGDRSAEQQVNEYVKQKQYKLETDATIKGKVTPSLDKTEYQFQDGNGGYSSRPLRQHQNNAWNGNFYPNQRHRGRWR